MKTTERLKPYVDLYIKTQDQKHAAEINSKEADKAGRLLVDILYEIDGLGLMAQFKTQLSNARNS